MEELTRHKRKFFDRVRDSTEKKGPNSSFLSRQEYEKRLTRLVQIEQLSQDAQAKLKKNDYFLIRTYRVMQVGSGSQQVNVLVKKGSTRRILPWEDLFDVLREKHISRGHCGRDILYDYVKQHYSNITQELCSLFVKDCEPCLLKKSRFRKSLTVKPILSNSFNSRAQVDLIDMQTQPDGNYRHIMVYQDHFTKFLRLFALESKSAAELASKLVDVFCELGAPYILQSDNGREFVNKLMNEVLALWPGLRMVHGKPRHSQSQGSVERANRDISALLACWRHENPALASRWSLGLRFVQFQKNSRRHSGSGQSPYRALLGSEPRIGLNSTGLPKEVIAKLETEQQLLQAYNLDVSDDEENGDQTPEVTGNAAKRMNSDMNEAANGGSEAASGVMNPTTDHGVVELNKDPDSIADSSELGAVFDGAYVDEADVLEDFENEALEELALANAMQCISCGKDTTGAHSCKHCNSFCHAIAPCCVKDGSEEEGYGSKVCCTRCSRQFAIASARALAKCKQKKQADRMLSDTAKKLKPVTIGDTVLVPIPEVDRGRAEFPNLKAVVLSSDNGLFKLGTAHGLLQSHYTRNELMPANSRLLQSSDVKQDTEISLREAVRREAMGSGPGRFSCQCIKDCSSSRCKCFKGKVLCNSKCHGSLSCKNK